MKLRAIAFFLGVLGARLLFACEPSADSPCLTEADARKLQAEFIAGRKMDVKAYSTPKVSHECLERGCYWTFFYNGIRPMPGNHFMLLVGDPSGLVELLPGA